jgi:hypothetical protein
VVTQAADVFNLPVDFATLGMVYEALSAADAVAVRSLHD